MKFEKGSDKQAVEFTLLLANKKFETAENLLLRLSKKTLFGKEFIEELYERGKLLSKWTDYFSEEYKKRILNVWNLKFFLRDEALWEDLFTELEKSKFLKKLEPLLQVHDSIHIWGNIYNYFSPLDRALIDAMLLSFQREWIVSIEKRWKEIWVSWLKIVSQQ